MANPVDGARLTLECKTAEQYMTDESGEPGSDEIPDEYLIQLAVQILIMGYHDKQKAGAGEGRFIAQW